MTIIIDGKSKCSICKEVLKASDETVSWSAFLDNEHTLWVYSDSVMHESCFESWEHKTEFEHLNNFQPLIDFDDPNLKEQIKNHGMPEWLKRIYDYRLRVKSKK